MNENIINSSETLIRSQKRRKLWLRIVIALACIVVFCTTYALILPAMTLGNTAYCGVEEHTHSESCYKTQLICTDENHTHTDNCYKKELICGKDEHTHSKACYSNPDEDKEAAEIWEKTLPESLSQSRRENIVSIAESQLGYSESEKNYSVSDDGALNGYTRYGEWYGDKYGDWSGMFVSFCLKYAGVPESEVPYGSETASWVQALSWKGLYKSAKEYAPQIGDIVFFDTDGNAKADRAGIVSEISGDTVKTIEGDSDNRVERKSYSLGDGTIVGFGFIPEKLSLAAPAPNAVTVKSDAELKNAVNAGGSIMLGADFTMSAVTVPAGKNVTLDLNGHKLTSNGSFTVQGNLTVTDSSASAETVTNEGGNSYGRTASAVKQGDGSVTLTYYVTETRVVNPASGATEEILKKHVVNSKGVINGGGQPVFTVQNGGNLSIEGGMVYGGSNRAVNMSGGNLNLKGGYISGFKKTGAIGTADQNFGGAVIATGGTVNISGAVLAGNDALNGGAIYAKGNAEINVTDGVISGNRSTRNSGNWGDHSEGAPYRCGGGGIFTSGANEITMTGGYITNNTAADDDYFDGGGGVLIGGTTVFTMDGGYITGNEASGGGGVRTDWGKKTFFNMNSGFISGNVARGAEGGGAAITQQGTGNFEGGYITNNVIVKTPHWGGGGLFCSDGSTIYLKSALITENAAGGFGGGVAGCPTGKIYLYIDEGCSIFDNTVNLYPDSPHLSGDGSAKGKDHDVCDDFFRAHGHKDYFCALSSTVTGKMLGGGAANWEGSADGKAVTGGMDDILQAINVMGLTSNPDAAGKKAAQDAAAVYINGNESYTHGGGILCNGDLIVGNPVDIEVPVSLELKATKLLLGGSGDALSLKDNNFTFTVKNEAGETVSSGKCDENGNITFAPKLEFSKDGTYTFYIKESTENKDRKSSMIQQSIGLL